MMLHDCMLVACLRLLARLLAQLDCLFSVHNIYTTVFTIYTRYQQHYILFTCSLLNSSSAVVNLARDSEHPKEIEISIHYISNSFHTFEE